MSEEYYCRFAYTKNILEYIKVEQLKISEKKRT